ncbi:hypothetical protein [Streptomyces vietnamensis]|uniref:hypothetical protein n=1 Tax=Streptomyces vietnamensis TaxID=362257 RepID=UPI0006964DF7|nr:hypothetical protein [Streptomyces vietnamensis]
MSAVEATVEAGAAAAAAALENATRRLRTVLDAPEAGEAGPAGASAWRASLDEELCDRLIDLAAARAWAAHQAAPAGGQDPAPAADVLRGCALWAVETDTARVLAMTGTGRSATDADAPDGTARAAVAAHGQVAALVTALAAAEVYDGVRDRLRTALGPCPAGRAAAAWEIAESALSGLGTTRDEWVGADPAHTAAGGWVLVDRIGRLALAVALLSAAPAYLDEQAEACVNAARRYTWNHLRQPAPEAATAVHVRRTAELVDWIAGSASAERSGV